MKNTQIKRTITDKKTLATLSSPESSPLKSPSRTVEEENLKKEKFSILRESFNSNKIDKNSYLEEGSASKLFDSQINNIDHAFMSTNNENFTNNSILFRTAEEIHKDIFDKLLKDYDYQVLENEILDDEEKLQKIYKDPKNLKCYEDQNGIKRGVCSLCRLECKGFKPNAIANYISTDKYPGYCQSCGCGASNHIPAEEKLSFFPQEILNLAVNSILIESNINFNSILVLFEIDNIGNDKNNDRKNSNSNGKNNLIINNDNEENIFNLIQLLKDAGFVINANSVQKINKDSDIYKLKSNIRNFYNANIQKNKYYEEKNKYEKLIENDDNNSNNILSERKFYLNKFDLVKYFLKDNLDEDKKFIEKVRDKTLDKTIKQVNENKFLGINNNNNNISYHSQINSLQNYNSELNFKINPKFSNSNFNLNNNAASEVINSSYRKNSIDNYSDLILKPAKNSLYYSSEDENYNNKIDRKFSKLNNDSEGTRSFYSSKKKRIQSSVEFETNFFSKFKNEILALTISINYQVKIIEFFEKFVLSCKKMFPQNMKLIYYSKSKINALWDVQVLFPDLFRIKYFISFLTEKPDFYDTILSENEKNKTLQKNNHLFKTSNKFFAMKSTLEEKLALNFPNFTQNNFYNRSVQNTMLNKNIQSTEDLQDSKDKNIESYDNFAINIINQGSNTLRVLPDQNLVRKILSKKSYKDSANEFNNKNNSHQNNKVHSLFDPSNKNNINDNNKEISIINKNIYNLNSQNIQNSDNLSSGYCSSDSYFNDSKTMKKSQNPSKLYKQLFSRYLDIQCSKGIMVNKKVMHYEKINEFIEKICIFEDFTFIKNFSNFISKSDFNSSLNCSILFNSFIGSSSLINTITDNNLDVLNISKSRDIELISNIFFQEVIEYDQISIVMRPYIVRSGISEIILNIFKINNFQILKRKLQVLNKDEAELLFKYEKLDENFKAYYIKMMTDSNSEIVLLSKFGALNDAKIICNGNNFDRANKNNTSLIDLLDMNFEMELKEEYSEIKKKVNNSKNYVKFAPKKIKEKFISFPTYNNDSNIFYNFNDLINFDFIIKKVIDKIISKYNSSINNTFRYTNLLELRKKFMNFSHVFNICMFIPQELENPKTQKNFNFSYINKYEIVKYFFPEFSDIQEAIIIIKPDPTEKFELNDYVKICLNRMNFEILECKKLRLNDLEISNLFEKYFHHVSTWEYSENRENFLNHECEVIRVIKSGCVLELKNILGKENFDFLKIENQSFSIFEDKLKILKNNCYLLYNSQESEYFYYRLCEKIAKIEGTYLLNFPDHIEMILDSCLKTTLGEHIRKDKNIDDSLLNRYLNYFHIGSTENYNLGLLRIIEQYMFSKKEKLFKNFPKNFENFFSLINLNNDLYNSNITFFVESENSGFFEIRIPYLQSYIINPTNLARENMINIDVNKMQLTKYYLYLTENFYNQLEEKFNNPDIIIDLEEFDYLLKSDNDLYSVCNNTESISARLFKKTKYEINKAYYKFCADNHLNITPLTYHYRIKPEDIDIDVNRIYEVEEFQGLLFLDVVSQDYLGYSDKESFKDFSFKNINEKLITLKNSGNLKTKNGFDLKSKNQNNLDAVNILEFEKYSNKKIKLAAYYEKVLEKSKLSKNNNIYNDSNINKEKEQYSLSSFLWGRKIAKLCKKFEALLNKREEELVKDNNETFKKNLEKRIADNMPEDFKVTENNKNIDKSNNELNHNEIKDDINKTKENFFGFNLNYLHLFKTKPDNVTNCGPLFFSLKEEKIKGIVVERFLCEYDQYLYINILHDLKTFQDCKYFETDIFTEKDYDIVENKLLDILNSRAFIEARLGKNLTLVPARLKENNLRINKKIPTSEKLKKQSTIYNNNINKSEENLKDKNINSILNKDITLNNDKNITNNIKSGYDPLQSNFNNPQKKTSVKITQLHNYFKSAIYEKMNQTTGKYICLSDVNFIKASVYRYYAAFLFILKIYYKKLDRKSYLFGKLEGVNLEDEYDKMLDAIIFGLDHFIDFDSKTDIRGFNCYKNEYFLFLISEIKYNLNELKNLQKIQREIESKLIEKQELENQQIKMKYQEKYYSIMNNNKETSQINKIKDDEEKNNFLKEEFMNLEAILPNVKKEISDINMNIE